MKVNPKAFAEALDDILCIYPVWVHNQSNFQEVRVECDLTL